MEQLRDIFKKSGILHHAYIVEGEREHVYEKLVNFLENYVKVAVKNNPDFWCGRFETFGIDDARAIKERQTLAAFSNTKKIFIILAERLTVEAQNALLKTLEEPTSGTHIFIIVPTVATILPTVRSRSIFLQETKSPSSEGKALRFLYASYNEREKLLHDIIEEKNRAKTLLFLNELEYSTKEKREAFYDLSAYSASLEAVGKCRTYLHGRSPSVKMLLEYLALTIPCVKDRQHKEKSMDNNL